jgi:hypothetical protein
MKITPLHCFFFALTVFLITACGGPIESMTFTSPENDRTIEITGVRESPAAPITVTVTLKVPKITKAFSFEHQAHSLTKESVTATWIDNNRCNLSFKLDDGTSWEVETFLLDDKVQAIKKNKIDGKAIFN